MGEYSLFFEYVTSRVDGDWLRYVMLKKRFKILWKKPPEFGSFIECFSDLT